MQNDKPFQSMLEVDQLNEAIAVHRIFIIFSFVYLLFGVADYFYAPEHLIKFLFLRAGYIIVPVAIFFTVKKVKSFRETEYLALIHALVASLIISYMIFSTSGIRSEYYAGLNLVGMIALSFFAFSWTFFWLTVAAIYLPYFLGVIFQGEIRSNFSTFILNSFFIVGNILVSAIIHYFREKYRYESVYSRYMLNQEVINRDELIQKKTEEAVNLSVLSSQFSPQVVQSIRDGQIDIHLRGGQRTEICTMFIDIVNSTERVTRIDKDKVEKVLSRFLDTAIKIMLKYDITIDKFLGDGILGFCNAPLKRNDYISRVLSASMEIKEKLKTDREFFEKNWLRELEIRVGVAKGYANVGFYGHQKYFRSYTAIGPVVNLAARLCSSADPGQILFDHDVYESICSDFETKYLEKRTLKGFEQDTIHVYEVISGKRISADQFGINECPSCGGLLTLETNASGHFVFMCKSCCSVVDFSEKKQAA